MRYPFGGSVRQFRWFHLVAIVLGLAAIVAVVYIIVQSGWLVERLSRTSEDAAAIEDSTI